MGDILEGLRRQVQLDDFAFGGEWTSLQTELMREAAAAIEQRDAEIARLRNELGRCASAMALGIEALLQWSAEYRMSLGSHDGAVCELRDAMRAALTHKEPK